MSEIKYLDPEQANSIPSIKQQFRFVKKALEDGQTIPDIDQIRANAAKGATAYQKPSGGIPASDLNSTVRSALSKAEGAISVPGEPGTVGQVLQLDAQGNPAWVTPSAGTTPDSAMSKSSTNAVQNKVITEELDKYAKKDGFYESMGVGTAVNLAGQIERTNDKTYRTSGGEEDIATGTARIEKVSGNTVVWNQQCVNPDFSTENNYIVLGGATLSRNNNELEVTPVEGTKGGFYRNMVTTVVENHIILTYCYHQGAAFQLFLYNEVGVYIPQHDTMTKVAKFHTVSGNTYTNSQCIFWNESGEVFKIKNTLGFDLTLIYGEGNEPTTVEQFEADYQKWFGKPLTYEPYNEGELIPVKMTGLKTTGFNQWDEEWEHGRIDSSTGGEIPDSSALRSKNYISVIPSTTYYIKIPTNCLVNTYDKNKNFVSYRRYGTGNATFTTTSNTAYIKFCTYTGVYTSDYNNDICINLHWSGTKDGTYEPYEEHTLPFDVTTLQGKLNGQGELVTPFADGLKKAGSVQDEIYYVGNKVFGVKRVGSVDLGSKEWTKVTAGSAFYSDTITDMVANGNICCFKYIPKYSNCLYPTIPSDVLELFPDKTLLQYIESGKAQKRIAIKNTSYTDAATFKTAMSGVMAYYELETPLVYELEDVELSARFKVNDWGTEEQLHAEGVNSAPAILSVFYGVNAVDALRRLPQNYVTINANGTNDTMHKFLAALGTAMGGTWAITVNENDPTDFGFTFTPNDESDDSSDNTEGE